MASRHCTASQPVYAPSRTMPSTSVCRPEAAAVVATGTLDGVAFTVGGLVPLANETGVAYLNRSSLAVRRATDSWRYVSHTFASSTGEVPAWPEGIRWAPRRYASTTQWPPRGARLTVTFAEGDDSASGIEMDVTFDLFTGVPLVAKHVRVRGGHCVVDA